jgi:spore germination protein
MLRSLTGVGVAIAMCSCSVDDLSVPPNYGIVSVSDAGMPLRPGSDDVPPTLDLRVHAEVAFRSQDVLATLDGGPLSLTASAGDLLSTVPPLKLGSAHHLAVAVAGRTGLGIDFSVIAPTPAMLAAHVDPTDGLVVDGVFAGAADQAQVSAALPGATVGWADPTHARMTWPAGPPAAIDLPATIQTARGSHLVAPMHLDLGGLHAGALRRVTVPAAPSPGRVGLSPFVVDTAASNTSLAAHLGALNAVCPVGWVAQADGSVVGTPDPVAVARAASARVPIWPSLANDALDPASTTTLLHTPAGVSQLVTTTVQAAAGNGYAGINLDFEGMAATDKDAFTAFAQALAAALHGHGIKLEVDIVPHEPSGVNQYSAAYDVPAIGAAADVVDLMAYDQHADGTAPGPVAGLDWDAALLAGTLPGLNPAHTLLGIPLYGRTWEGGHGAARGFGEAVTVGLSSPGARVGYDFGAETPVIKSADGSRVTYFDDADSLARKIGLVSKFSLAGVAPWRLGFEDPSFWSLVG